MSVGSTRFTVLTIYKSTLNRLVCKLSSASCVRMLIKPIFKGNKTFRVCIIDVDRSIFLSHCNWSVGISIMKWVFKPKVASIGVVVEKKLCRLLSTRSVQLSTELIAVDTTFSEPTNDSPSGRLHGQYWCSFTFIIMVPLLGTNVLSYPIIYVD